MTSIRDAVLDANLPEIPPAAIPAYPGPFPTQVHVSVPLDEWRAHTAKVEACVELLNGLVGALANHPMLGAMIPQDVRDILAKAS